MWPDVVIASKKIWSHWFTPPADEKKMGTIWIFGYYLFFGLKVGEGLDFQIWDLNGAHETERTVFPIPQVLSMCRRRL